MLATTKPYLNLYLRQGKKFINNIENVCICLENDADLVGKFFYDRLSNKAMMRIGGGLQEVTDYDITDIQRYLQSQCALFTVSDKLVAQAVSRIAYANPFHPVIDYLKKVEGDWDGVRRTDQWLTRTLGVANNYYTREAGEITLQQACARVYEPGCQADYILVLVGEQGIGKSKTCKILFHPWFTDMLPDITSKDGSMALAGVWGIEIAEMYAFLRHEGPATKSFTTRQKERYRLPYGRSIQEFGRQCVLVGTSNVQQFNTDTTGGRRNFGVICEEEGAANTEWLERNRDQLWGEAASRYRAGVPRYPSREAEAEFFRSQQQITQEYDELTASVLNYANAQTGQFRITDIWNFKFAQSGPIPLPLARRIGPILRHNGYQDFQVKGIMYWKLRDDWWQRDQKRREEGE